MLTAEQKARVKWACRRGMLELDVIIMPFFEQCFDDLHENEQQDFIDLLAYDDPLLFMWLMGRGQSNNENINAMVNKIAQFNRSQFS